MSNLHEQYAELLRRGMPECERLHWRVWMNGGWWLDDADDSGNWIRGGDARDLITMHALRWWLGAESPDKTRVAHVLKSGSALFDVGEEAEFVHGGGHVASASTIIDAILAATEHLSPEPEWELAQGGAIGCQACGSNKVMWQIDDHSQRMCGDCCAEWVEE